MILKLKESITKPKYQRFCFVENYWLSCKQGISMFNTNLKAVIKITMIKCWYYLLKMVSLLLQILYKY